MACNMDLTETPNPDEVPCITGKSTLHTEEKRVKWIIEHFSIVVEQKLPGVNFTCDVGDSIGVPCTWNINLEHNQNANPGVEMVRFVMSCIHKNRPDDKISIRFDAYITHGCSTLLNVTEDKRFVGEWLKVYSKPMKDDVAVVQLKLTIFSDIVTCHRPEINDILKYESVQKMSENMQQLLDSGFKSDFVIKVPSDHVSSDYELFNVHKNILAARSEVFKAMFETPMLESQSGEATFEDLSPAGLKTVIQFIYTGTVDENWKNNAKEVVDFANRFELPTLKKFVDVNLHLICNAENAIDLLQMAKLYGLTSAFRGVVKYIQSNMHDITKAL